MNDWKTGFEEWLGDRVSSRRTIESYLLDVALYERWFEVVNQAPFSPELMNSTDARSYRTHTLEIERRAPATWNRRRASLGMLCAYIEAELGMKLFPMSRIPRAEEVGLAPRWLSEQDKRRVLRSLEMDVYSANTDARRERAIRDQAMFALMIFSGLRVSEVVNLRGGDITIGERSGMARIRSGKGGVFRMVPLSKTVREMVRNHVQDRFRADEFLFRGENGAKISQRAVQKRLKAIGQRLGLDGLSPHALRHTCAKSMVDAGVGLNVVQKVLGHKRTTTTALYVTPGADDLAQAVDMGEMGRFARSEAR